MTPEYMLAFFTEAMTAANLLDPDRSGPMIIWAFIEQRTKGFGFIEFRTLAEARLDTLLWIARARARARARTGTRTTGSDLPRLLTIQAESVYALNGIELLGRKLHVNRSREYAHICMCMCMLHVHVYSVCIAWA